MPYVTPVLRFFQIKAFINTKDRIAILQFLHEPFGRRMVYLTIVTSMNKDICVNDDVLQHPFLAPLCSLLGQSPMPGLLLNSLQKIPLAIPEQPHSLKAGSGESSPYLPRPQCSR